MSTDEPVVPVVDELEADVEVVVDVFPVVGCAVTDEDVVVTDVAVALGEIEADGDGVGVTVGVGVAGGVTPRYISAMVWPLAVT